MAVSTTISVPFIVVGKDRGMNSFRVLHNARKTFNKFAGFRPTGSECQFERQNNDLTSMQPYLGDTKADTMKPYSVASASVGFSAPRTQNG